MAQRSMSPNTVDGFLHLAVTAVRSFHRIGRRFQVFVVKESQGLVQIRGVEFREDRPQALKTEQLRAKLGQSSQGRLGAAAPIKEGIDFGHELPQCPQVGMASGDLAQRLIFRLTEAALNEKVAVGKKFTDPIPHPLGLASPPGLLPSGTAPAQSRHLGMEGLSNLGDRPEDIAGDLFQHMEFTHLVTDTRESLLDRLRIKRGAIRRYAPEPETTIRKHQGHPLKESPHIVLFRIVIQYVIGQPSLAPAVHQGQDAERPIVDLIRRQIPRKISKGPIRIFRPKPFFAFFFPLPRPSSVPSRKEHTPDGLATGAMRPCEEATHLQSPAARPRR